MRSILQNKHGYEVGKRHKNKKFNRVIIRLFDPGPEGKKTFKEASPPSITMEEMQANVGIGDKAQVYAARKKVEEFRMVSPRHDDGGEKYVGDGMVYIFGMTTTATHTFAKLVLSQTAYDEIQSKLKAAGYQHAFGRDGIIDMHGLGLERSKKQVDAGHIPGMFD